MLRNIMQYKYSPFYTGDVLWDQLKMATIDWNTLRIDTSGGDVKFGALFH